MFRLRQDNLLSAILTLLLLAGAVFAQTAIIDNIPEDVQEVSEIDGVPVIVKNLPNYDSVKDKAVFINDAKKFAAAVGDHPVAGVVLFTPGTEAAVADYPEGKFALVEFTNPQMATEMDAVITTKLAEMITAGQPVPTYRKVGNYAVFVFNPSDGAAAETLIGQVKYEKVAQWVVGNDPYAFEKLERYYVETTSDVVINTIRLAGIILFVTLLLGGTAGFIVYRLRNRQLTNADAYTDSGMITLNIENLSAQNSVDRLLNSKNL